MSEWKQCWDEVGKLREAVDNLRLSLAERCPATVPLDIRPDATAATIQNIVAIKFGVSVAELCGPTRPERIVWPRQVAMYLCREYRLMTLESIGAAFGGRDHGTVLHACTRVKQRMETELEARCAVSDLKQTLLRY